MNIIDVITPVQEDRSITSYEYRVHKPFNTNQINKSDEIIIEILNSDLFLHLSEAFIYVEGHVSGFQRVALVEIKMVSMFPFFRFDEVRLELYGKTINSSINVGISSVIKNLLSTTAQESYTASQMGWYSSPLMLKSGSKFSFCLPLKNFLVSLKTIEK